MLVLFVFVLVSVSDGAAMLPGNHSNNWAVLVDTSRFWFNYRHAANVYSMYRAVRRLGIPDSHIVLMVADGMACDAQNPFPARVFNDESQNVNVYGDRIEVDYRGYEVTAEALMRVLTGRHAVSVPNSKRLLSDASSNVLVYLTGHGGDEFFKFQDAGEISSYDLADAFHSMHQKGRYNEMLVMVDTCQANTLYERLYSPNVVMVGSSRRGENSWSKGQDGLLGTTLVDRFTDATLRFVEQRMPVERGRPSSAVPGGSPSLLQLLESYDPLVLDSHVGWVSKLTRPLARVPLRDFFGQAIRSQPLPPAVARPSAPSAQWHAVRSSPQSQYELLPPAASNSILSVIQAYGSVVLISTLAVALALASAVK